MPDTAVRPETPFLLPGQTSAGMTEHVAATPLRPSTPRWWWIAFAASGSLVGLGAVAVGWLFASGIQVFGNDWPVMWGFPIINYVWWIAIASGGTIVSAVFFLTRAEWRTSVNRIAESMTLCAAACAGLFPILHLGRPWFFYWLFPYPNTMTLWPQFRSPLVWDFFAVLAYILSSVVFWYIGLLPDLATMRDVAGSRRAQVFYGALALGFRGSGTQWRRLRATYGAMAALMAPLVVSVHSIVGLDFAGGQTVGWHSTQFPILFVFGAMLSGLATVILLVLPLRDVLHLEGYITRRHIDVLAKLILLSSLLIGFTYLMDAFSTWYGPAQADRTMFTARVTGQYAYVYWGKIACNVALPQLLWIAPLRQVKALLMTIAVAIIIGMWWERYEIVVTSLHRPDLPSSWGDYHATIWDFALLAGTVGLFLGMFLLCIRLLPIVSMFEMRKLIRDKA